MSVSLPASFAVLHSLTGGLGEDDTLQLSELQDLQKVDHHSNIRHHVVGQISRQNLSIWSTSNQYVRITFFAILSKQIMFMVVLALRHFSTNKSPDSHSGVHLFIVQTILIYVKHCFSLTSVFVSVSFKLQAECISLLFSLFLISSSFHSGFSLMDHQPLENLFLSWM